ncbi:MAG TPA: hypothetical protein P5268_00250 [Candidatus Marinimicrobia bacterium]|nr:hypothetical protein [Candidatus Neomarinimicrobiota bacterium]HRS51313.1 hypothetical protein [Candidatus Neomarinimicrobiota bacterium]HRU91449.1 hypothetical protein [Candidatus Neomarinimicrobiota bacterium]
MQKFKIIIIAGVAFLFSFCDLKIPSESDYPTWSVSLNVPLLNETVTVNDLLEDSLIVKLPYGTTGDSIFAYEDQIPIEEVRVGNKLNIDDITQSIEQGVDEVNIAESEKKYSSGFSQVGVKPVSEQNKNIIGDIQLDDSDVESTTPILFSEIVDMSGIADGASTTIAKSTPFPTKDRQITFNNFANANFIGGILEINIRNNLVVELGAPIYVRLLDASSNPIVGTDGDSAKAVWTEGLSSGNSSKKTIDLTNKTLPGTIIVQVSGVICGSAATNVTKNTTTLNSSFVVEVQAKEITASSATAIVPEQTIDTTGTIEFAGDEPNKVETAVIKDGHLKINIQNNLPVSANLELTIPSLKTTSGGSNFYQVIPMAANQTVNQEYSLTDNKLEMDITKQEVNYSYIVRTIPTDPQMVNISSTDQVDVNIDMYGKDSESDITFSEIRGIVEPQNVKDSGEINTASDARISTAQISSGGMTFSIENNINEGTSGIPHLILEFPELVSTAGTPVTVESDLPAGQTEINYDLSNCTIQPLSEQVTVDSVRQYITYNSLVTTSSGEIAEYNLMDSIKVDINVSEMTFSSVTGYFDQEAIVANEVLELEDKTKLETAQISNGNLILTFVNNIGVVADVHFTISEIVHRTDRSPLNRIIHLPSSSQPVIETIPLDEYNIKLPFTDLNTNQKIHYTSRVSIPSDREMTITFAQKINVDVQLTEMEFSQVSGYIDTVRVDIEPTENEVNALPEGFDGINLKNVEMVIDFNTNIGVPVELHLFISSFNEKGGSVNREIHQVITENPRVVIPDAEELINIKPKKIVTSGYALVGGTGQVDTAQYVGGNMYISVPFEMEVTEGAKMKFDPSLVKEDIPEEIEMAILYAEVENGFEIGGKLILLAAQDTLLFDAAPPYGADTLAVINVYPDSTFREVVELGEKQTALFQDSVYVKTQFNLVGRTDDAGNPIPSRFMKDDKLKILLYGTINGLIDFADRKEK